MTQICSIYLCLRKKPVFCNDFMKLLNANIMLANFLCQFTMLELLAEFLNGVKYCCQKASQKVLSNHNKHKPTFKKNTFVSKTKSELKSQNELFFLISSKVSNSQSKEFVLITESF